MRIHITKPVISLIDIQRIQIIEDCIVIKMANYKFEIIQKNELFKVISTFKAGIIADNIYDAQNKIEKVYPFNEGYTCKLIEQWDQIME